MIFIPPCSQIWGRIRQRTNLEFTGPYTLCQQFDSGVPCKIQQEKCWFCHSKEEMEIWKANRAGRFSFQEVQEHLIRCPQAGSQRGPGKAPGAPSLQGAQQNQAHPKVATATETARTGTAMAGARAGPNDQRRSLGGQGPPGMPLHQRLMEKVQGGTFLFLCGACFRGQPQVLADRRPPWSSCSGPGAHRWDDNKALVHKLRRQDGRETYQLVRHRPQGIPAKAKLCSNMLRFFQCPYGDYCKFAHAQVRQRPTNKNGEPASKILTEKPLFFFFLAFRQAKK